MSKAQTMDGGGASAPPVATAAAEPKKQRFAPSGISADGYADTRVRRWEVYQRSAIKKIVTRAESELSGDAQRKELARALGTCLVRPYRPVGTASLYRPGAGGAARIADQVPVDQIRAALRTCMELSNI